MVKLTSFLILHRRVVLLVFFIVAALAAGLIPLVGVNYDLAEYLPEDSASRRALNAMADEFAFSGSAVLMAEKIGVAEALALKDRLLEIDGVNSVLWLDDVADLNQPLANINKAYLERFYTDNCALYTMTFVEDDYSLRTGGALVAARQAAAAYNPAVYGMAEESRATREAVKGELFNIMLVVIPVCLLILLIISHSWFEPALYIFIICVAVLINMGTNICFSSVSYIIFSMGAAIQLAVSMDYSLFLTHRFEEELASGRQLADALTTAVKRTFPSIFASALTTIVGFAALGLMRYGIGRDIGFVLAKGVTISFICVILFLPPLLFVCHKLIDRTRHRTLLQISARAGRGLTRLRYPLLVLALLIVIPAYFAQLNTPFYYGDSSGSTAEGVAAADKARIREHFKLNDQLVILVPNGDIAAETALCDDLAASPYVDDVQSLVTLASPTIPRSMLPQALTDNFVGEHYTRLVVYINAVTENDAMFDCVDFLEKACSAYFGDAWYMAGKAVSIADIKDSVLQDINETMGFSMLAVALIILFTFRSLIIPVLLIAVIESAIYINMAVPYFLDQPVVFIGYLVVSSLQLGATIDYAILLASRYGEARRVMLPRAAVAEAVHRAGVSVLTSGLILATAGFAEYWLSSMSAVATIGLLIARGALLSVVLVLLVLPALLTMFDAPIRWLTVKSGFMRKHVKNQGGGPI